jgi:exopolysaccharide production protein ExoY
MCPSSQAEAPCSGEIGYCMQQCPSVPPPGWKRVADVVAAGTAVALLSPVFVLVAVFIRCVSRGPVLFKQSRMGLSGRPFTCFKFRTMHTGAGQTSHKEHIRQLLETDSAMQKLDSARDPRIIPGGQLLRRSGIDELPQLANILLGQMSLVGPRPCIPYEFEQYCHCKQQRVCVTPGLTGLWQVSGKNRTTYDEMVRLDIEYSQTLSPFNDLRIVLRTFPVLVGQVMERTTAPIVDKTLRSHSEQGTLAADDRRESEPG